MNVVILTGRITKDPEVRYTQSNIANCSFTLAVDRGFKDANGNKQADFINCVAWRQQAEFLSRYVKKGNMLVVNGSIQVRSYQGQDGQQRYVTEVIVERLENVTPKEQAPQPQQQQYQGYQQPQYNNYSQPQYNNYQSQQPPQSFGVNVADDDLPF